MHTIKIRQWPSPVLHTKGTVLDAALNQGVPFPHTCRSGECGSCKSQLLVGQVHHDTYLEDALTEAEKGEGYFLPCRAVPKTDLEVAWVSEPDSIQSTTPQRRTSTVVAIDAAAHNVTRLCLKVHEPPLVFAAGQYVRLSIAGSSLRSYSMANLAGESILEFHIRQLPNGQVSSLIANELRIGDRVELDGPYGDAFLREAHDGPILAVGGGTGLAPMLSIARTAIQRQPGRSLQVYFGVQDERDAYACQALAELEGSGDQIRTHVVLSVPGQPSARRTGFVHQCVAADFESLAGFKIYAAGPPPMVNAVRKLALSRGVDPKDIHADPFVASGVETDADEGGILQSLGRMFKRAA